MLEDLRYVYTTIAKPSRRLPGGAIEEGRYRVDGNTVILYDTSGKSILAKQEIRPPLNAHETAARMLKRRPSATRSFSAPIPLSRRRLALNSRPLIAARLRGFLYSCSCPAWLRLGRRYAGRGLTPQAFSCDGIYTSLVCILT
jgi:hypothetical protein